MTSTTAAGPVLHVIESVGVYGIERVLLSLLPALQRNGWAVGIACMGERWSARGQIGEEAAKLGLPVWYVGYPGRLSARGLFRLQRTISESRARLVHLHGYKATILAGGLCLAGKLPAIATYHCEAEKAVGLPRYYIGAETQILRRLDCVIAVSQAVREELLRRGVPVERVVVVPNGIPSEAATVAGEAAATVPPFGPTLLTVGRLVAEKNIGAALRVLAVVRAKYPGAGLLIAGEGPLRAQLEAEARALGVHDAVRFLGFVEQPRRLFSHCDCFLLPSNTEGLPIALLEAMAAGVPIVASGVGGVPGAIANEVGGILVPAGDLESLVSGVMRVLNDRCLASALGRGARERFEEAFTDERMVERYIARYDRTLGLGMRAAL
jgi:glycosyltransferase involved in cell wall biosynthesis